LGILPPIEPIVGTVVNSSPAEKSGIKQGDKILEINNSIVNNWTDIKNLVNEANGQEISLKLLREGNVDVLKVKPKLSENNFNWQIGISAAYILSPESREFIRYGFLDAFKNSISQTYSVIENSIIFIGKIMFGQVSAKNLGGPVMIGQYAGESVIYGGFYSFIYLIAFISISLGIVNLFPLPVLDGGQALILTIEKILGRDLPAQLLDFSNKIGTLLLLFLFIFVFFNDIFRIVA
jgi:regulator of sigma E protease